MEWQWYQAATSDSKFGSATGPRQKTESLDRFDGHIACDPPLVSAPVALRREGTLRIESFPAPAAESVPDVTSERPQGKIKRRWKKLSWFILWETIALALLVTSILAGTAEQMTQIRFTLPFQLAVLVTASAAVLIPVIFYGLPRIDYKMRRYR